MPLIDGSWVWRPDVITAFMDAALTPPMDGKPARMDVGAGLSAALLMEPQLFLHQLRLYVAKRREAWGPAEGVILERLMFGETPAQELAGPLEGTANYRDESVVGSILPGGKRGV